MKCGARVALGVAGGYLLGRTRKMKLALMLGGMVAGRRAGGPGELLAQGSKLVSRSPELSQLVGDVRGRLLDAGKDAAMAVATRQVESWADRVAGRPGGGSAPPTEDENEEPSAQDATERPSDNEESPASGGDGAAGRSRSGGTATRARRSTSTRAAGRATRTAKKARPARTGREARDD